MAIGRPAESEYAPHFERYLALVHEDDVIVALGAQADEIRRLTAPLAPERETHRYVPEKWSVRQVIGHVIDGERVFGYRAFAISRGEQAALPAFDENAYVAQSPYERIPLADLVGELASVREANLTFLRRLDPADWTRRGTANGKAVSVRALAFLMVGHARHHVAILRERYRLG